jgi:Exonuclease III
MKLKIISFNIKNNFSRSQKEQKRLDEIIKFLNEENADVIGLQEVNSYVRKILAVALRDYYVIGDSRK